MGLPIFFEPTEPATTTKSAEKGTSGSRSSIRRGIRAIRGPNARANADRRRRMLGMIESERILDELDRPRPAYLRPSGDGIDGWVPSAHRQSLRQMPEDSPQAISFERQTPPTTEAVRPLMPAVPESRDYSSTGDRQRTMQRMHQDRQDLRRMARRRPVPTPPYTETDLAFISRNSPRHSSSAPRLSPPDGSEQEEEVANRLLYDSDDVLNPRSRPALSERTSFPLPRINNQRAMTSRALERQARRLDGLGERLDGLDTRISGLGDRERSPEGDGAWHTLLTSITPDPHSAGSSFASSSAAAAASSANTSMTSLARTESPTTRDCDILSESDNTEDDDEDMYELQQFSSRSRDFRHWRSYADVVTTTREDRGDRNTSDTEPLGGDMHRIILRLAARDEIPDDWWAQSGLTQNRQSTIQSEPAT